MAYFKPEQKKEMTTLSSILEKLRVKKIDNEFQNTPKGFTAENSKFYQPHDLKIIRTYRFEGESNPDDNAIVYVIEANDGLVGYSLDAYGVYSNHDTAYDDFIRQIPVEEKDEELVF
ncbi:MAG: hypothetical protein ACTHK0_12825 [Ginsengibacter sp.]